VQARIVGRKVVENLFQGYFGPVQSKPF